MTNIENFNPENLLSARIGRLSRSEALDLGMKLCEELAPFSSKGEFHGSVRPDNISIDGEEITLGPAMEEGKELGPGELEYISPEQFWNSQPGAASDVYSLGLTLYAACNEGRLPFLPELGEYSPEDRANALRRRMQGEAPEMPAAAGEKFGAIIMKAIDFSADKRYKSAEELSRALRTCPISEQPIAPPALETSPEPVPVPAPSREYKVDKQFEPTEPVKPKKKKEPAKINTGMVIAVILVLVAIVAVVLIFRGCGTNTPPPEDSASPTVATDVSPTPSAKPTPEPTPSPVVTDTPEPTPTPDDFTEPMDVIFYEVVFADLSWEEASARCEEMGGHLATVSSQSELDEITAVLDEAGASFAWLGAYRAEGDRWTWVSGEEVSFFDWASGEPSYVDTDGTQENFLILWNMGGDGWKYNDCRPNPAAAYPRIFSGKIAFVCEYDYE